MGLSTHRRNHHAEVTRRRDFLQGKLRLLNKDEKEELLVRAALRDDATAGDIVQTAMGFPGGNQRIVEFDGLIGSDEHRTAVIKAKLSVMDEDAFDDLLIRAGQRSDATAGDITQTAIDH